MAKSKAQVQFEAVTDGFTSEIKAMDKTLATLRKELNLNSAELQGNADDVDLLADRKQILQQESEATQKKIEALSKKLDVAKGTFGENSKEAYQLSNKLIDTQTAYQKIQTQIGLTDRKLEEINQSTKATETAFEALSREIKEQESKLSTLKNEYSSVVLEQGQNSAKAKELEQKMQTLNAELAENKSKLSQAEKASDDFTTALKNADGASDEAKDGFTVMGGALSDITSNVIQGVVSFIGDLVGSLFDLIGATEEYRSMQAKLSGASETFGYSIDFANSQYEKFYAYLGDDQMATNAITNLMGLGTSTENVTELANGAIGAWASYGDSIPIESLTESINETIQVGKVTGTMADTINWAKVSNEELSKALSGNKEAQKAFNKAIEEGLPIEDAFNEALSSTTDEQERADIMAQFLNSTYGKSKETYDEMAGSIIEANRAELELKQTQSELAEAVSPVNTTFTELKNSVLQALLPVVEGVCNGFSVLKGYLEEHPTLAKVLTAVVLGLASAFAVFACALMIGGIIQIVTTALGALGTVMAVITSPITIIIAIITALVAIFIYLWNTCEGFRNFWIELWETIKSAVSNAKDKVISVVGNIKDKVTSVFDGLKSKVSNIWNSIKDTIGSKMENARDKVKNVIDKIKGLFNFTFSLPKIKVPKFSISPKGWKVGDLLKGTIPKLSVAWNAKGGIFQKPTLFQTSGTAFQGVGEAGAEAVLPLERLESWINRGFNQVVNNNYYGTEKLDQLIEVAENILNKSSDMYVNGRKVSEALAESNDNVSGQRYNFKNRGLVL